MNPKKEGLFNADNLKKNTPLVIGQVVLNWLQNILTNMGGILYEGIFST